MNTNHISKTIILGFIFLLIVNNSWPSSVIESSLYQTHNSVLKPPRVIITRINDGNGLTVTLTNIGKDTIKNITLSITSTGGLFVFVPKNHFEIESISSQSSKTVTIDLFGIGIGKLNDYPTLTMRVSTPDSLPVDKTVTLQIIGSFCTNLGEFFNSPQSFQGYTLFSPEYSKYAFLINNDGQIVHEWKSDYLQGLPNYLDEQGNLIRGCSKIDNLVFASGGFTGRVEKWDWNNTLLWEFDYSTNQYCLHHDIEPLPNGNILMISWEYKTAQEAIARGRNPALIQQNAVWPDKIIEVEPIGTNEYEIVWEWHVWDHLIQDYDTSKPHYGTISDYPGRININYGTAHSDWTHINSIDYHQEFDQILLSVHNFNEIWVIDHSTTTEEAASSSGGRYGKGGDILYRWGNPRAYKKGSKEDQQFFGQHDARWIPEGFPGEGNILVFNNGQGRPDGFYSSIDEINPPVSTDGKYFINEEGTYGPAFPIWQYISNPPFLFFSGHISGAQRLPNGNTLICSGADGLFFEVNRRGETVWSYTNTFPNAFNNHVFKIQRYGLDYPGVRFLT